MKRVFLIVLLLIVLSACSVNSSQNFDSKSIQNTAVVIALTTISQTQVQGTQLSKLAQITPTIAITPTFLTTLANDDGIKQALLKLLGLRDSQMKFTTEYNDEKLAIGYYSNTSMMIFTDGSWIAQKDHNGIWGIVYISKGTPPCKDLQKLNLNDTQPPSQCLDSNGNVMIRWQWRGQ
jgi:hypothetical protein